MKNNKGITLIALIVTIILLLIIATISIKFATENNGIIERAEQTRNIVDKQTFIENIKMELLNITIDNKGKKLSGDNLKNELSKQLPNYEISINDFTGNVIAKYGDNEVEIDSNYNIIDVNRLEETIADFFIFNETLNMITGVNPKYLNEEKTEILDDKYKNIVIPKQINGKDVKNIGSSAFSNIKNIESVYLQKSISQIGTYAFSECTALKKVIIPETVTKIYGNSFNNCSNIKEVQIPIQFSLSINFSKSKETITKVIFVKGEGANEIISNSCSGLTKITEITMPEGITKIGNSAFDGCTMLSKVNMSNTVENIGGMAFYNCENLQSIKLPAQLKTIGTSAFAGCKKIEEIEIPRGVDTIQQSTFSECTALKKVIIPETVTKIYGNSFYKCNNIEIIFKGTVPPGKNWSATNVTIITE